MAMAQTIVDVEMADRNGGEVVRNQYPLAAWMALRNDYVMGKGSLPELCRKHGFNLRAAEKRCAGEKWRNQRAQWKAKKEANFERKLELSQNPASTSEPQAGNTALKPVESVSTRARVIERLIDQTERAFEQAMDAREMQALAMALDRLYGTWSLLTGHEKPGVRKSSKSLRQRPAYTGLPEPDPEPSLHQSSV